MIPSLFTVAIERDQSEILEEDVDIRAIGNGTRRSWSIDVLKTSHLLSRHLALPENLSGLTIETDHQQHVLVVCGDEDSIARQHRRRMSWRKFSFPDDVLVWTKLGWQSLGRRNAGSVWTTKL